MGVAKSWKSLRSRGELNECEKLVQASFVAMKMEVINSWMGK